MFSIDGASLSPWMIVLLVICGAITSAVAGKLADSGWKAATRKDLELYMELNDLARNDKEKAIAQKLLDIAFRRVDRNTNKGATAGMSILSAAAEYPYLTFFAIILAVAMLGSAYLGNEIDLTSTCFLGCICAGMDIFNRIVRIAISRSERKDEDAEDSKKRRNG